MSTVFIRADASNDVGTGHVMRCLTLADELRKLNKCIVFICKNLTGSLCSFIAKRGYKVHILNGLTLFDWEDDASQCLRIIGSYSNEKILIVDHYLIDVHWEKMLNKFVSKLVIIDDLANRIHDCDILLDQNYYTNMETRYQEIVPVNCKLLLGPKFALLREEFIKQLGHLRFRSGRIEKILIFYGGSDPTHETLKCLEAFQSENFSGIKFDVVIGSSNCQKDAVLEFCSSTPNYKYHCQVENMAELMADADLAIGAGGTTSWERLILGLPAIVTIIAENQREVVEALARKKAILNLGWYKEVTKEYLTKAVKLLIENRELVSLMSANGKKIMGLSRDVGVSAVIKEILGELDHVEI
jgi:UDP-2,4-diacetamido-2,4,6-trideoxy-beta-L-altropyranose hydrolase